MINAENIPNLQIIGVDLLKDNLTDEYIESELDKDKNLLIYEVGLTMYLSQSDQEILFGKIDKLFRKMNNKCILLTASFDRKKDSNNRKNISLNGLVFAIEKLFRSKIHIDNHSPDAFFSRRGYRIVKGGEVLHNNVRLDALHGGLSITGYVINE